MPEYKAPGVYVEEMPRGPRPIEGVPTSVAGFAGTATCGPAGPQLVTSLDEYLKIFGAGGSLSQGVRAFFTNGGQRLYIARIGGTGATAISAALETLGAIDEIAIVAAPDASLDPSDVARALMGHAAEFRYRLAVIDAPQGASVNALRRFRAAYDSSSAAMYCPWVTTAGDGGMTVLLPPSGFVAGIFARVDKSAGVWKAPANEALDGATGLEFTFSDNDQSVLNPEGINAIRAFPGGGLRVWGARTMSSDPEWKYINVRRLFIYLEHSIDHGLQWAVFEPNGPDLWAVVRETVSNFLSNEWKSGALQGAKPEQAYFVKCDRTTMTQNDLDNGRLICLVGVAPVKPAEFVIFRISSKTADTPHPP